MDKKQYRLGIDIGSTTVKIAILDEKNEVLFSDYQRHFANIQETLARLLVEAREKLGEIDLVPMITGSGGLTLATHLHVTFVQEVVAVATALKAIAPKTDVAIELGGEDAKIIYFTGGIDQRTTRPFTRLRRAAAYSRNRTFSLSSTRARPAKTSRLRFSRRS